MTTPPDQPYRLGDIMPTPPRRTNTGLIVGTAVAVAAVALLAVGAALALDSRASNPPATAAATTAGGENCAHYGVDANTGRVACTDGEPVVNQGPTYAAPSASDIKVTVKVLKRECFGSAGCNVTYRIDPAYAGAPLDPSVTWLVTYEVHGVEDGPAINSFTVTGEQASFEAEEFAQTKTKSAKLTVKVTDVTQE